MTNPISLDVTDLHKSYRLGPDTIEVLRGISFRMQAGQSLAIVGPSGAGKSTLLHLIGTLDAPTSGTIEIGGRMPHLLPEPELAAFRNRAIGFVFQDHHLLPQYSVLENVLLPAMAPGKGGAAAERRAVDLIERVGLSGRLAHRPAELSGGERQRAAVARALVNGPGLLLCDEPTGNLDAASAAGVAAMLFDLHRRERNILIAVTHGLELAAMFERRLKLSEGVCSEV
jgi:lipoprotein-releasing system ATP-binding protein